MDESIPTIPASEAARLDREDAERRDRPDMQADVQKVVDFNLSRLLLKNYERSKREALERIRWRPEQHAADIFGDDNGK